MADFALRVDGAIAPAHPPSLNEGSHVTCPAATVSGHQRPGALLCIPRILRGAMKEGLQRSRARCRRSRQLFADEKRADISKIERAWFFIGLLSKQFIAPLLSHRTLRLTTHDSKLQSKLRARRRAGLSPTLRYVLETRRKVDDDVSCASIGSCKASCLNTRPRPGARSLRGTGPAARSQACGIESSRSYRSDVAEPSRIVFPPHR